MIDYGTISSAIAAIVSAILTYLIARTRTKIDINKQWAAINMKIVDMVTKIEENAKKDLKFDLEELKSKNENLEEVVKLLQEKVNEKSKIIDSMRGEILSLQAVIASYEKQIKLMEINLKFDCPNYPDCQLRKTTIEALNQLVFKKGECN